MKKILVTGANGFIGKSITKKLLEHHFVETYCRELKKDDPSFIVDNHLDQEILVSPYKDIVYDYVINCIACSDTSSKDWSTLYEANCQTTMSLINNLNFKHFIQFSSFSIFSEHSIATGTADPNNLYGLSKLISEKFLEIHSNKENKFIVLRMPIVIGGSKRQGDIIRYLYKALIRNETIDLFNDGKYHRNIIHVDEVTGCVAKIVAESKFIEEYSAINLNSLNTMSMYEICNYMKDKLKSHSKIQFNDRVTINDFDSLIVDNPQQIDCYCFKSCSESIDCFLEEMRSDTCEK